mmetsp:Transcript_64773/g.154689  ORF Transcript_64773/g.154689 Transcript_64773/m.154689 type:complete len:208 (+) Transcript_64773:855-1478(+)
MPCIFAVVVAFSTRIPCRLLETLISSKTIFSTSNRRPSELSSARTLRMTASLPADVNTPVLASTSRPGPLFERAEKLVMFTLARWPRKRAPPPAFLMVVTSAISHNIIGHDAKIPYPPCSSIFTSSNSTSTSFTSVPMRSKPSMKLRTKSVWWIRTLDLSGFFAPKMQIPRSWLPSNLLLLMSRSTALASVMMPANLLKQILLDSLI